MEQRVETSQLKTFEVFFNNEDAQKAVQEENTPPVIGDIKFNPKNPKQDKMSQHQSQQQTKRTFR